MNFFLMNLISCVKISNKTKVSKISIFYQIVVYEF